MQVKIKKLREDAIVPTYATEGSGCFDLYSLAETSVYKGRPFVFDTGLSFEIPKGYVMLLFSRSGHGFNSDVRLSNCVGVIDEDYRGEVKIKLTADRNNYDVKYKERIAQGLILPVSKVEFTETKELSTTERGLSGFGSSGK